MVRIVLVPGHERKDKPPTVPYIAVFDGQRHHKMRHPRLSKQLKKASRVQRLVERGMAVMAAIEMVNSQQDEQHERQAA